MEFLQLRKQLLEIEQSAVRRIGGVTTTGDLAAVQRDSHAASGSRGRRSVGPAAASVGVSGVRPARDVGATPNAVEGNFGATAPARTRTSSVERPSIEHGGAGPSTATEAAVSRVTATISHKAPLLSAPTDGAVAPHLPPRNGRNLAWTSATHLSIEETKDDGGGAAGSTAPGDGPTAASAEFELPDTHHDRDRAARASHAVAEPFGASAPVRFPPRASLPSAAATSAARSRGAGAAAGGRRDAPRASLRDFTPTTRPGVVAWQSTGVAPSHGVPSRTAPVAAAFASTTASDPGRGGGGASGASAGMPVPAGESNFKLTLSDGAGRVDSPNSHPRHADSDVTSAALARTGTVGGASGNMDASSISARQSWSESHSTAGHFDASPFPRAGLTMSASSDQLTVGAGVPRGTDLTRTGPSHGGGAGDSRRLAVAAVAGSHNAPMAGRPLSASSTTSSTSSNTTSALARAGQLVAANVPAAQVDPLLLPDLDTTAAALAVEATARRRRRSSVNSNGGVSESLSVSVTLDVEPPLCSQRDSDAGSSGHKRLEGSAGVAAAGAGAANVIGGVSALEPNASDAKVTAAVDGVRGTLTSLAAVQTKRGHRGRSVSNAESAAGDLEPAGGSSGVHRRHPTSKDPESQRATVTTQAGVPNANLNPASGGGPRRSDVLLVRHAHQEVHKAARQVRF